MNSGFQNVFSRNGLEKVEEEFSINCVHSPWRNVVAYQKRISNFGQSSSRKILSRHIVNSLILYAKNLQKIIHEIRLRPTVFPLFKKQVGGLNLTGSKDL